MRKFRWINPVLLIFLLLERKALDDWIAPTIPVTPFQTPSMGTVGPMPFYFRPG